MTDRIPRHWLIIAERGAGKSTFAASLSPEYLVCDLDGRWAEQKNPDKSHVITESDPLAMVKKMEEMLPHLRGSVETVIYDSGTAVMDFIQARGRLMEADAAAKKQKFNLNNIHRLKADTMRVLRLAALKWHCDVLYIFHTENSIESGKTKTRTTISQLEMDRLKASLNAVLTIVRDPKSNMRGIRIEWCRFHENAAAGQVIWDVEGKWQTVAEKLDVFLQSFMGTEGFNGNMYSGLWLLSFLKNKGIEYADVHDMYVKLDVRDEPPFFDRNGWAKLIEKALPK